MTPPGAGLQRSGAVAELTQHEMQDAPMAVVEPLVRGVDAHARVELDRVSPTLRGGRDLQFPGAILELARS